MKKVHSDLIAPLEKNEKLLEKDRKVIKLTAQIEELTAYEKFIMERYYHSILNFIGYAAAGVVLWFLMHGHFDTLWSNNAEVLDEHRRFKDIWNAAMYIVPYCFWGMATKHVSIVVIGILDIYFSKFKVSRLKKKIGYNAP